MGTSENGIPVLNPCVPLPISENELFSIVDKAKDWALMHGVGMRNKKEFSKDSLQVNFGKLYYCTSDCLLCYCFLSFFLQFAPFVLTPSAFPRSEFYKAVEMQPILNELTHRVAHDEEFLRDALATTLSVDDFTAKLYNIWQIVKKEGIKQVRNALHLFQGIIMQPLSCQMILMSLFFHCLCWSLISMGPIITHLNHLICFEEKRKSNSIRV